MGQLGFTEGCGIGWNAMMIRRPLERTGGKGNEEILFSCMYCTNFYQRAVVGVSVRVGDDET